MVTRYNTAPLSTAESYPLEDATSAGDTEGVPRNRQRAGLVLSLLAASALGLFAATADSTMEQRLLNGGAIGAGFGGLGTALSGGCVPCGAMIGLMVRAGAGHFYDLREESRPGSVAARRLSE